MELSPGAPAPPGRQHGAPSGGAGRSRQAFAAGALVDSAIVLALHSAGFRRSSAQAVGMLGEVMQRYITLLGNSARDRAEASNRTTPHLRDVCASLEDVGVDLDELLAWLPLSAAQAASAPGAGPDTPALTDQRLRAAALVRPEEAEAPPSRLVLQYLPRDPADRRHALAAAGIVPPENGESANGDAVDLDSSLSDAGDALFSPSSSGPSSRTSYSAEPPETSARYLTSHEFIPSHLPPLPTLPKHEHNEAAGPGELSEVFERIASPSPAPSPSPPRQAAPTAPAGASHDTVPFSGSRFAEARGPDAILDLPRIDASVLRKRPAASCERETSLYAYAANLRALQAEPTSSATANYKIDDTDAALPDPAMRLARAKRRRIAATVADVGQFSPADTLYAGVPVRANAPFSPAPSILVTAPPPLPVQPGEPPPHLAPQLSMTHPHGQSVALFPPSGALQPALGYRWPAQVASAAMAVADHDVRRRVSRLMDPSPLLDDKGTERVFHGKPAPRHLLGLSYGALSPAINELRSAWHAAHPGAEFASPQRGTLVYTWDWAARDPYDRNLPGQVVQPPGCSLGTTTVPSKPPSPTRPHPKPLSHSRSPAPAPQTPSHPLAHEVRTDEAPSAAGPPVQDEMANGRHSPSDAAAQPDQLLQAGPRVESPPRTASAPAVHGQDAPAVLSGRDANMVPAGPSERAKPSPPPAAAALLAPLSRSPRLPPVSFERPVASVSNERHPLPAHPAPHAGTGRPPSLSPHNTPNPPTMGNTPTTPNGVKEGPMASPHAPASPAPVALSPSASVQDLPSGSALPHPKPTPPPSTTGMSPGGGGAGGKQPPEM